MKLKSNYYVNVDIIIVKYMSKQSQEISDLMHYDNFVITTVCVACKHSIKSLDVSI